MDKKLFDQIIEEWQNLYRQARRFDNHWKSLEHEKLTDNQLATVHSIYDQHNAWYAEMGMNLDEIS